MKEKLKVSAKQIEWDGGVGFNCGLVEGYVSGHCLYEFWENPTGVVFVSPCVSVSEELDSILINTGYRPDQAKQACQDHLQQYVDGLLLQLQQLTEIENED